MTVKHWDKRQDKADEAQLRDYFINSRERLKPEIGVLTNGLEWHFYLRPLQPRRKTDPQELRQFDEINISKANCMESVFTKFLALDSITSIKKTTVVAKELYKERTRASAVRAGLQETVSDLTTDGNTLAEALAMIAERKGIHPTKEQLADFVKSVQISVVSQDRPKPIAFTLRTNNTDVRVKVGSWSNLKTKLCNLIAGQHPEDFAITVLDQLSDWFSNTETDDKPHKRIGATGISVKDRRSDESVRQLCLRLLAAFGYTDDALTIRINRS